MKILIVNRGEIAIRIAKAINELGYISVGVWTDNEPNPPHLQYCQQWVHLEGTSNTETYLNTDKILSIIKKYKINAVHPGYGFLSENFRFVDQLEKNGVIFIGPSAKPIELMGDKATSKKIAREVGVPVVPGSDGEINSALEAIKIAEKIKYPVILKAVAGGGGKGMRLCNSDQDITSNFDIVAREAKSSFGYGGLLIEKYIENPHHIEVQIIADKKGNIFHAFERECSIQRRHQKIIEEAPSPFIGDDEALRLKICQEAIKLAKAVNYDSVGTVEFIMGEDREFYFLEMNTRIQVEHPITEEITRIDLVRNMIKAALGQSLDIKSQSDVKILGHSIECRICSEDPNTMLPSPGLVSGFDTSLPQSVRFDHCLFKGLEVTPSFDPMLGKLITHGLNRDIAIEKMSKSLDGVFIEGLKNNIPLLKVIVRDEVFKRGHYSTNYISKEKPQERLDNNFFNNRDVLVEKLSYLLTE